MNMILASTILQILITPCRTETEDERRCGPSNPYTLASVLQYTNLSSINSVASTQAEHVFITEDRNLIELRKVILDRITEKCRAGERVWNTTLSMEEYTEMITIHGHDIVDLIVMDCIYQTKTKHNIKVAGRTLKPAFSGDKVTVLVLNGTKIERIPGVALKFFSDVEYLHMDNCGLTNPADITPLFDYLPNLKYLSLNGNDFTRVPDVHYFYKLIGLYLKDNHNLTILNVNDVSFPDTLEEVCLENTNIGIFEMARLKRRYPEVAICYSFLQNTVTAFVRRYIPW